MIFKVFSSLKNKHDSLKKKLHPNKLGGNSGIIILYSQLLIIPVNMLIDANNGKPHPN